MDLKAYRMEGWNPQIRPGEQQRKWMDETSDSFAYRCLPISMANMHGWELLNPVTFDCRWRGGSSTEDLDFVVHGDGSPYEMGQSVFGHGILTFHAHALFRTEPGWNLWVSGRPNHFKDGIQPLTGLIETDWAVSTFTMNWRFTRPNQWVRFEKDEPFCFIFPVQRGILENVDPKFVSFHDEGDVRTQYLKWSSSRDKFRTKMASCPRDSVKTADTWQKDYYQGKDSNGSKFEDHQVKIRLKSFK